MPKIFHSHHFNTTHELLHVEAPGCIVNIHAGLSDNQGRKVTRISVDADGDKYAGDPQWWCPDLQDPKGTAVRVVQMKSRPEVDVVDSLVDELDDVLQDASVSAAWSSTSQVTMLLRYISRFEKRTDDFKRFLEQQIVLEHQMAMDATDDSMDGDHETGMRDAGFGTDEDYGCY